jgi:hypothetical protein
MASHERLLKDRLVGLACASFVLILCAGAEIFAQQRGANAPSGKLYLVAATLAMMEQPSGYPVTVYEVANGTIKTVREVIRPYPDSGDGITESTPAPTAIGRILASENALYFIHVSSDGRNPNSISIVHFDNPAKADDLQVRAAGFVISNPLTVVSRSTSEDELLIPTFTLRGQPPFQPESANLTSILITPERTQVTVNSDAWGDYALQFAGQIGGPNPNYLWNWGVASGDNLVVALAGVPSFVGHTLVLDELPPTLRGTQTKLWVRAANDRYLISHELDYSKNPGATSHVFVHDRVGNQWKTLQLDGNSMTTILRLFGSWLASIESSLVPPERAQHPGRENERAGGDDRLPDIRGRYEAEDKELGEQRSLATSTPGILVLDNLADGRKIRVVTGQEDSEILDVTGDTVFYRVNNAIYTAQIVGDKLAPAKVLCRGDDVPEVHWSFWSK